MESFIYIVLYIAAAPHLNCIQHVDQSFDLASANRTKKGYFEIETNEKTRDNSATHIRPANPSAGFIRLVISSALAMIVYMLLMLASMASVSWVTLPRYTSTLSAANAEMLCNSVSRCSVRPSTDAARYCASHSTSLMTVTSIWCNAAAYGCNIIIIIYYYYFNSSIKQFFVLLSNEIPFIVHVILH